MQRTWKGLSAMRQGLLVAVSLAALSGCVSAVSNDMRADAVTPTAGAEETTMAEGSADNAAYVETAGAADGRLVADANGGNVALNADTEQATDMAGMVMQPTTLNAGKSSIFSTAGAATASGDGSAYAAGAEAGNANPAFSSIYANGDQGTGNSGRLPLEDMPVPDLAGQGANVPLLGDEEASAIPANVPLPKSARSAMLAESQAGNAAELALTPDVQEMAAASLPTEEKTEQNDRKKLTLASLFGVKRKATPQFDGDRFAEKPKRVINRDTVGETRKASLGIDPLPGVIARNAMFATSNHSEAEEDEEDVVESRPRFKEVASLAGLARLAPNGLWLQTEKVNTGCFKPELLEVLKSIEKHYGKPIIVTSGLREAKRNRSRQSLHTRCEAADIQIAGVSKWELADYLRTMPGRGGVGTYCHTESVHIDVGSERDWNWRCRRRK
jgi:uncharacterized protein YcbK (DUF882 family)